MNPKMHPILRHALLLILFFLPVALSAQQIKGKVVDTAGEPLSFVNVVLLTEADSTFVTGTTSDDEGLFLLTPPGPGAFCIRFSFIGFENTVLPLREDMGTVTLRPSAIQLDDVVIRGNLPTHKLTASGVQTQVQGTVLGNLGTAGDILAHVPGLQKKGEGYEVFGKGSPLIYINGRPLRDLSELEQLKSSQVKSIELITSPGARYDASVGAVVRIKTVQAVGEGLGIDARSTWQQSENTDLINQLNLNYQRRGLTLFGMGEFTTVGDYQHALVSQEIQADTLWQQNNTLDVDQRRKQVKAQAGLNYIFNDNHALGFRFDTRKTVDYDASSLTTSEVLTNRLPYDYNETHNSDYLIGSHTNAANFYYNGKAAGWSIDFNADWQRGDENYGSTYDEQSDNYEDRTLSSENYIHNDLWAAKLILTHSLWGGEFSLGAEYTHTDRHDDYINPEGYVPSSYTLLKDRGISPFVEYTTMLPFGRLQAGLRYEAIEFDYFSNGVHQDEQSRSFHNWFPSLTFGTQLGKVQAMLSATVKTRRPNYSELRGNVSYYNRFTLQTGNPFLKPTTIYESSLQMMWKILSFRISYADRRNMVLMFATQKQNQPSVTVLGYENFDSYKRLDAMLVASPQFGALRPQLALGMFKPWMALPTAAGTLHFNQPLFVVQLGGTYQLTPTCFGDFNLRFQSRGETENVKVRQAMWNSSASITKTFLKKRLSLKLAVNDIFHAKEDVKLFNQQMQLIQINQTDSRHVDVTLRYTFNTTPNKYKGTGAGNAEKERL